MKICPYCNEEIADNLDVCPICGEALNKSTNITEKISFNIKRVILSIVGISIIVGLVYISFRYYESSSFDKVTFTHEDTDPYENTMSMKESLDTLAKQGESITEYIKTFHLSSNKDKAFSNFMNNLNYYAEVFSYQNGHKYDNYDCDDRLFVLLSGHSNNNISCLSASNKKLMQQQKTIIDDIEVTPVFGEETPPNSQAPFSYLKVTNIEVPFIKLVYFAGYCSGRTYLNGGKGYIVDCDGPDYYVAEPNYKYLKVTYTPYLSEVWKEYFDIKINQQKTLRNSAFANGNGGMKPAYISSEDVEEWTNSFVALLKKYPNFVMYDNIADEIIEMNYPSYKSLLDELPQNSKLYSKLKKAQEDLDAEFSY